LSISGTMPLTFTDNDIVLAGAATPWIVPVLVLGVVSAAIAYVLGISGVARLRPGYASLLGLGEVLCGVIAAWVLLGESVTAAQAMGGAVVLLGLALAGMGDHTSGPAASPPPVSDRRNCKAHSSYPADSVAATTAGVVAGQLQPAVARPELWSGSL
jgi:EamA-like transporter family